MEKGNVQVVRGVDLFNKKITQYGCVLGITSEEFIDVVTAEGRQSWHVDDCEIADCNNHKG